VRHQDVSGLRRASGYVRTLSKHEELPLLRDHLLRLDPESRHDRFNGFLDDSFIERYAAKCAENRTTIIAYIEDGVVRGAAELHPPHHSPDALPEVAFSVEASVRRQGVGSLLFKRLISEARWKRYRSLRITTGAENRAMRALASKFGAHLTFKQGESTGTVDLKAQQQLEFPRHVMTASADAARAMMWLNRANWKLLMRLYGGRTVWQSLMSKPTTLP
jgi:GNAT superfamily N-acetyltransferase